MLQRHLLGIGLPSLHMHMGGACRQFNGPLCGMFHQMTAVVSKKLVTAQKAALATILREKRQGRVKEEKRGPEP